MRTIPLAVSALLAFALLIAGCATNDSPARSSYSLPPLRADTIARLAVDGPYAYINGRPAPNGSYVFDGDTVTTGANTSANVILNDGGSVQLDQETDREFRLLRQGACLLLKILRGQAAIETNGRCIEFRNDRLNTAGVAHSLVNLRVTEEEAWVTVIEGSVDMIAPRAALLGAYDQYSATRDGASSLQRMTPADAAASIVWRQRYFQGTQPQSRGLSTGEKAGIAAGAAAILYGIFGRNRKTAPRPDATAGSRGSQPANTGWCCFGTGPGESTTQALCTRMEGTYHPGMTNSRVCPRGPNAQ